MTTYLTNLCFGREGFMCGGIHELWLGGGVKELSVGGQMIKPKFKGETTWAKLPEGNGKGVKRFFIFLLL